MPVHEGRADFEGHQTWYLVVGDLDAARAGIGPAPLVTLHGGPGATHDYLLSMADLADDGRAVVFYDQTGNGNSTHFPDRGADYYTVDLFVRELASLIEHLGIGDRYHVLGQSWGGMLAQEHAITAPGRAALGGAVQHRGLVRPLRRGGQQAPRRTCRPRWRQTLRRHEEAGTRPATRSTPRPATSSTAATCAGWTSGRPRCCAPSSSSTPTRPSTTPPTARRSSTSSARSRTGRRRTGWTGSACPALVISGRHDEATPAVQEDLVSGLEQSEQVILERVLAHAILGRAGCIYGSTSATSSARHD